MTKPPVIGLLGGGQLGRMLCEAAGPLGYEIIILDALDAPAKKINHHPHHVEGSFKDPIKVRELASKVDVLTVEIEHVNTEVLEEVATKGVRDPSTGDMRKVPVHPSWKTLRLVQDKFLQKEHFKERGVSIAPQMSLDGDLDSLREAYEKLAFPFMVKARKGSYDGRGNFKVKGPEDFGAAIKALGGLPLYAEKWVPFVMELAVMVVRTEDDDGNLIGVHSFPVVETVHEDDVCKTTFMPPRKVDAATCAKAKAVAEEVIKSLWGRGVFAVEMFLLEDGTIMVNEVAPRPHNSGHYTIEAVPSLSQYKAQLHSIMNYIPPQLELRPEVSKAIMLNILGGALPESHDHLSHLARTEDIKGTSTYLHLYGKASKPGRKIGHITFTSPAEVDLEKTIEPFINEVDQMRLARLNAASAQLRPSAPQEEKSASSRNSKSPLVIVTMGSDSDLHVLGPGLDVLEKFGVPYDCTITSAHRTPARMTELAHKAAGRGVKVIIAAAGGAAHLPGMLASETTVPVIGVPVKATHLDGVDSLHSIVQMPRGVPVATVGINNSTNAALLAIRMLGSHYPEYQEKLARHQATMKEEVEVKAETLEDIGYQAYLEKQGKR